MRRTLVLALVTLFAVAACSSTTNNPAPASSTSGPADFPVTVGSVTLTQRPTHIVSLSPTATEMLFAIGAGSQVVAADSYSDYPANAPKTDLSAYQPNAEAIAKYQPDLVILAEDSNKIASQLAALHIPAFLSPAAKTIDDTYREFTELGALTGHQADAAAEVATIRTSVTKIVHDTPDHRPLTYYYELDQTYYSVTSATFVGSLFSLLGLTNIADAGNSANPYPQLSGEVIIKDNPDLIFLADTKCCGQSAQTVAKRPGWSGLTAVKTNEVVNLDDDIASRWGPRVVDLLQAIAQAVAKAPAS
jgi:iron complex transport system substrate-binding protein